MFIPLVKSYITGRCPFPVIPPHVAAPTAAAETTTTADFVYADFNSTHGLTFTGASGTTACANVTELEYGDVQGDADQLQGSLDEATREAGEEVVTTDVRTSELGEHEQITPLQVRASESVYSSALFYSVLKPDCFVY